MKCLTWFLGVLGLEEPMEPRGVLSDGEARAQNVGGEVICTVF